MLKLACVTQMLKSHKNAWPAKAACPRARFKLKAGGKEVLKRAGAGG
jgi:hypothetical protein